VFSASIQQLAGGLRDLIMSDSSSPPPSPPASINDEAKRVEDDVSIDSSVEGETSDDARDTEKDTIVVKPLDEDADEVFQLRAYQDEMLAESIKRNTIIVLNTGAGKTHM
jgi:superfamily II DNA or RNA helicase